MIHIRNFFKKVSGKLHIAEFKFLLFIFGGKNMSSK